MTLPTWRDWLFSVKAFIAAMIALYIGLAFSLPRPYWAMTAVYVVANPISAATVSKSFDRTLGTLLGATGAVILVPLLVNAPELLMLAIAIWAGVLLYIALHDRTPRNYVFLLAGYTLPLIALPTVDAPGTIFDVALARSEEIIVGIVVASVIGTVLFPMSVGPILNARVAKWLNDARAWAKDILLSPSVEPFTPLSRQQLAADISPMTALISQLAHDAGTRDIKRHAEDLRGRLLFLLPVLSAIADRLHALRLEAGELSPEIQSITERIAAWIETPYDPANGQAADDLRSSLRVLEVRAGEKTLWQRLIHLSLVARLGELVDLWQDCLTLQHLISLGGTSRKWRPMLRHRPIAGGALHYDRGLMFFTLASTVLATFTAGLLWIWSGWPGGANAVAFVAIVCCFFGSADRPATFMRTMLIWSCIAYAATGVYIFTILPRINDFELLVLTLAPPFLLIGAFIPRPELSLITLLLATNLAGDLGLQGRFGADFTSYLEGGVAITVGVVFALIWTLITRPFGAEFAAERLIRAGWMDLADLASGAHPHKHATLVSRMLDRLGQLVPRLASNDGSALRAVDGLAELRTGFNVLALRRNRRSVAQSSKQSIDRVLAGVSSYFRQCAMEGDRRSAPDSLLHDIDGALQAVMQSEGGQFRRTSLDALVGVRRSLFPLAAGPQDNTQKSRHDEELPQIPYAFG